MSYFETITDAFRARKGQRLRCKAVVESFGSRYAIRGLYEDAILLEDIVDAATGEPLMEQLWFPLGKWAAGLKIGDIIEFDASVGDQHILRPARVEKRAVAA